MGASVVKTLQILMSRLTWTKPYRGSGLTAHNAGLLQIGSDTASSAGNQKRRHWRAEAKQLVDQGIRLW